MKYWPLILTVNIVLTLAAAFPVKWATDDAFRRGKGLGYAEAEDKLYPKGWQSSVSPWRFTHQGITDVCADLCSAKEAKP